MATPITTTTTRTTPTKGTEVTEIRKIDENRKKALDAALTQIERQFGGTREAIRLAATEAALQGLLERLRRG